MSYVHAIYKSIKEHILICKLSKAFFDKKFWEKKAHEKGVFSYFYKSQGTNFWYVWVFNLLKLIKNVQKWLYLYKRVRKDKAHVEVTVKYDFIVLLFAFFTIKKFSVAK